MAMMKTIVILRHNCMAPIGSRKYGVCTSGEQKVALVYVDSKEKAERMAEAMNRVRRRLSKDRPHLFRRCVGPDHRWLGRFAPPLLRKGKKSVIQRRITENVPMCWLMRIGKNMCLSNEGLSHEESAEMIRQVRLGRAIGEVYATAQGISGSVSGLACQMVARTDSMRNAPKIWEWRRFGFNAVMKKYHMKVRA